MLRVDVVGHQDVVDAVHALTMNRDKRKTIFKKAAERTRNSAKTRTQNQQTVLGSRMAPRKRGKSKVLQNIAKKKNFRVLKLTDTGVVLGWRGAVGKVAAKHQHGYQERYTRGKFKKEQAAKEGRAKRANGDDPCTKAQAKQLAAEGFRQRVGKSRVRRSVKWMMENLTQNQAGAILRYMQEELGTGENKGKDSWNVVYPARPFAAIDADAIVEDTRDTMRI